MRIGILTFHDALNCGAVLQAYALQCFLEAQGHHVEFIDYSCRPKFTFKSILGKSIYNTANKIVNFYHAKLFGYGRSYNRVLTLGEQRIKNEKDLKKLNDCYDVFIVGSDQVWNFKHRLSSVYLLDFVEHKKKIAYAVSMGQCEVPVHLYQELVSKLESFDLISCRESNAVEFLSKLIINTKEIKQCVDPTVLANKDIYEQILKYPNEKKYIASYILNQIDSTQIEMITQFGRNQELPIINLRNPDTCIKLKGANNIIVDPYNWLGYIKNADFVICGSFHATVFSLIFHKKFIVIESKEIFNSGGNMRIRSMLRPLGLEYRCICHNDIQEIINRPIDWLSIDEILSSMRMNSVEILNSAINK